MESGKMCLQVEIQIAQNNENHDYKQIISIFKDLNEY